MRFEWPVMLIGLLFIPVLVGLYWLAQRRRRTYAVRFTNLELLESIAGRSPAWRRHIPPALYLLGSSLLLISMARPMAVIRVPREQAAIVLVMDVSGSMSATDLRPDRLTAAKEAAYAFLDTIPEETQVALVSFQDITSALVPLTRDHAQVRRGIDQLAARGSTAMGDGLYAGLELLNTRPIDENGERGPALIVLLSDGESNRGLPPLEAAGYASEAQVSVYTVGIGQRGVTTILKGQPTRLDELTMMAVAESTGGNYFYAAGANELEEIYAALGSKLAWVQESTEITAVVGGLAMLLFSAGGLLGLRWFHQFP